MKSQLKQYRKTNFFQLWIGLIILFIFSACEDQLSEADINAQEINDFLNTQSFNANEVLNIQQISSTSERTQTNQENQNPFRQGGFNVSCITTDYNLKANFEDVAILRPNNGIIYPGALVLADENLLKGTPTPLEIDKAPARLRIDLPGMGENGNLDVPDPDFGNVEAARDNALDWWNNNAYQEGYVNPAYISYQASSSFSSQQVSIDLGLNVAWATGEVSSEFNYTSTTTKKVAMMAFKQGFYAVTMQTPQRPSDVFAPSVSLSDLENQIGPTAALAYVHTVIYGRIIMFRMETTVETNSTNVELALEYATGVTNVTGAAKTTVDNILANSTINVITIGGNASVASQAVSAKGFADLQAIIQGENAVYSKSNPGVPISYVIRYLHDNTIARMGYSTDYSVVECSKALVPGATISIIHEAGYVAWAEVSYLDKNGVSRKANTGSFSLGFKKDLVLPAGAHNINLNVDYRGVFDWFDFFTQKFTVPVNRCYKIWGTAFSPQYGSCN